MKTGKQDTSKDGDVSEEMIPMEAPSANIFKIEESKWVFLLQVEVSISKRKTFIMKRIGVAIQHTTEGTSPASRQEVAPPTFSTISKCSFHQRRHYPQYQFGKLAKH